MLCEARQDGCEVDGELSKEVQCNAADISEFFLSVGVLIEDPGRGVFDEPVGKIGQCHHFSHGQVEVTRVVGRGEFFEVEVEVIESRPELGGVVVSEPIRVEVFKVG